MERVIAYASRVLSPAEANYCVTRRELLAIVEFTKRFRQYLLGTKFLIRTDHDALTWLKKTPQPVGQNARWLEQLGEYCFDLIHRPGTRHGNADAMSRRPCDKPNMCFYCKQHIVHCGAIHAVEQTDRSACDDVDDAWGKETFIKAQSEDPEIKPVYEALLHPDPSWIDGKPPMEMARPWSEGSRILLADWHKLSFYQGRLCRRWEDPNGLYFKMQVIIPQKYREEVVMRTHGGMTGGHLGRDKTFDQISRRMYWPHWKTSVRLLLKSCKPCAQYHRGPQPKQVGLKPFPAGMPFETWSIDVTGPHTPSRDGNVYILTLVDSFTKWTEAFAIRRHTAEIVVRKLVEEVFSRFGTPLRLLSDRGPEFESGILAELCRSYQIDKIRTTSYQPSTNGALERFHKTMNSMIGKVVEESQRDWDRRLPEVMHAYRSTIHSSRITFSCWGWRPEHLWT